MVTQRLPQINEMKYLGVDVSSSRDCLNVHGINNIFIFISLSGSNRNNKSKITK